MKNWLYYHIQHTLSIAEPFYKYLGYGVLNTHHVHHVRAINEFVLSEVKS
jgi:hypothetical protein